MSYHHLAGAVDLARQDEKRRAELDDRITRDGERAPAGQGTDRTRINITRLLPEDMERCTIRQLESLLSAAMAELRRRRAR